ncbi:MAG: UDP-N-acetylglucosamine 1-carboxyvinyltransferase [Clostridiaceae bacterium]|jgi:UDP-N-acetylglucosamine 1-carboxyvinyltransferase|nr:UDP-N-acetylglucosamine 1-carboxyvinyltransferase [Clostridiaceae bacterium]
MGKYLIHGQTPLIGEVQISGSKNAAVAIIPAALLVEGKCRIENIPDIGDVKVLTDVLIHMGAKVSYIDRNTIEIDSSQINTYKATYEMVKSLRGSYYIIGALLGRFGQAEVPFPGGCNFGYRPIDQHIKGFEALGAKVEMEYGIIKAKASKLSGTSIYLDVVSVGATINLMLSAVKAEGVTVIENAAKEPHVVDVANFLNAMGADIRGAGTDVIKIKGVKKLKGGKTHCIIPDQIEAGTFMIAGAGKGNCITVKNVIPKHMESLTAKLLEMGARVEDFEDSIRVTGTDKLVRANIKTLPYPGFPTDLHPQMSALLCLAEGTSTVTEGIWETRFQYVEELKRMGAAIKVEGRMAVIEGVKQLTGAPAKALDLRAGAALVIAALFAKGETEVSNISYIDRGYENFDFKLKSLGAEIKKID